MKGSRLAPPSTRTQRILLAAELEPADPGSAEVTRAVARTRRYLLGAQHPAGYWVGELEGDTILESEYILLLAFLGRHQSDRARKTARYIIGKQLPSGGWALYPGGKLDVSASVKAYFALKLTGHSASSPALQRARLAILAHGGADAVNSFTRYYLALLGQISYDECPAVPPEMLLLPRWLPINLYRISAWSRTILVPLSIMSARQPVTQLPAELGIAELMLKRPEHWPPLRCPGQEASRGLLGWDRFFRGLDALLKRLTRWKCMPLRSRAVRAAERWMLERFVGSEGLGAIFPPMIFSIIALKALGYDDDTPELEYCYEHLEGLVIDDGEAVHLEPCKSPIWDTALALRAMVAGGAARSDERLASAADWLVRQEIRQRGDWAETVKAEPSGWCFEYANQFYPDVDDTVMALMALETFSGEVHFGQGRKASALEAWLGATPMRGSSSGRDAAALADRAASACRRGLDWVLAMQNRDGGWGAFDRDNDAAFLCRVPFADHNAMIDPSTPDLAGRTLEMLGQFGWRVGQPAVDRAVDFLRRTQEADGSWFGRWGVNYVYGTWQSLTGLAAVGVAATDPVVAAGINWLVAHQQPSGGWGESPDSYAEPALRGEGPVTASQTAWAVLALVAAGQHEHRATRRGIRFLLDWQQADGTWHEAEFTGTGFPQVFYLRYHMYPIYFPLLALARYAVAMNLPLPVSEAAAEETELAPSDGGA